MKTLKFKCLGVEASKDVPENMSELMKLGLSEDQIVATAVKQILYHVFLGDVRDKVQELVEEQYKDTPSLHRGFEFAKDKDGKATKSKKYTESVEKWLESLKDRGELDDTLIAEFVEAAVEDTTFKATSPREKKDPELEARLKRAEDIMKLDGAEEKFAAKCKRNDVEPPKTWAKEDIARALRDIDLAI